MTEPLSPVQVETRLRSLVNELTRAQSSLADARNAEVIAEVALRKARITAAANAPRPRRGEVTVAERDEHIEALTLEEWTALKWAASARENAQDYLRVVRDQAEVARSLGASVRTAYGLAGTS